MLANLFQDIYQSQFGRDPAEEEMPSASTSRLYEMQRFASTSSAIFSIAGAGVRAGDLERQAGDQLIMAEAEETAALQRSNAILQRQMEVSGRLRAAFAASGVDLGSATVGQLDRENRRTAQDALTKTRNSGARRAAQRRYASAALARRAAETFGAGLIDGVLSAAESGMKG